MKVDIEGYFYADTCPECGEDWSADIHVDAELPKKVEVMLKCDRCTHSKWIILSLEQLDLVVEVYLCRNHAHLSASIDRELKLVDANIKVKTSEAYSEFSSYYIPFVYDEDKREKLKEVIETVLELDSSVETLIGRGKEEKVGKISPRYYLAHG